MSDLPNWVYELVMELQRWHDEHGLIYEQTFNAAASKHEFTKATYCGCAAFDHIPDEVKQRRAHADLSEPPRRSDAGPSGRRRRSPVPEAVQPVWPAMDRTGLRTDPRSCSG